MTKIERIRQNLKTLEELRSEGEISSSSYLNERERLNRELARELGTSKSKVREIDNSFEDEEE